MTCTRTPHPSIEPSQTPNHTHNSIAKQSNASNAHVVASIAAADAHPPLLTQFRLAEPFLRCDLPGRDLRLLDPVFVYPSTILGREHAVVVNLEKIRCIITAEEVLLLNTPDPAVAQVTQFSRWLKSLATLQ